MTDLSTNLGTQSSTATTSVSGVAEAASDGADKLISSDFETFLNMLTAQLQNQDPLNPLQSTDFAVQLATFSGVEQQVLSNDRLAELTNQLATSSLSSLSNWIGSEVLAEIDISYDGTPVDLMVAPEAGATTAQLIFYDQNDNAVGNLTVGRDGGPVQWSGETNSGSLPPGQYRVSTASFDPSGNLISEQITPSYHPVVEVLPNNGDPVLSLKGGQSIAAEAVSAVRR